MKTVNTTNSVLSVFVFFAVLKQFTYQTAYQYALKTLHSLCLTHHIKHKKKEKVWKQWKIQVINNVLLEIF